MKEFFKELFKYSHHFNQKLGDVFMNHPDKVSEKAIRLHNHILNAHRIWNNRINPKDTLPGVWDTQPTANFNSIDQSNYEHSILILDEFKLNQVVDYTNTQGHAFSNQVQTLLFHVINHSTYHRAQIATEFRLCGIEPIPTDYVAYKR